MHYQNICGSILLFNMDPTHLKNKNKMHKILNNHKIHSSKLWPGIAGEGDVRFLATVPIQFFIKFQMSSYDTVTQ